MHLLALQISKALNGFLFIYCYQGLYTYYCKLTFSCFIGDLLDKTTGPFGCTIEVLACVQYMVWEEEGTREYGGWGRSLCLTMLQSK